MDSRDPIFELPERRPADGQIVDLLKGTPPDCIYRQWLYPTNVICVPLAYIFTGTYAEQFADRPELTEFFWDQTFPNGTAARAIAQLRQIDTRGVFSGDRMTKFVRWYDPKESIFYGSTEIEAPHQPARIVNIAPPKT